jgi:tetratricopeptide (TPR) repeat protein
VTEPSAGLRAALAGRYDIERELGEGGMAVVYLARDLKHDRPVALKILRPDVAVGLGVERFVREIRVVAQLQHPHILPLFDSGEADGLPYFVTPYIEGESLHDRLVRDRQLPLGEALSIARQVAGALAYAHSRGIVHRDIKPANILLEGGEAIVADFGIALALSAARLGRRMTESGLALGTPTYMSPEQAAGAEVLDHRSDLYSLGCVLYEMLAGAPPFPAPTPQAVVASHLHDTPAPLSALRSALPPVLEQTVERALAKSPDDRFDTATAFVAALDAVAPARGWQARLWRRRRWLIPASVVVALGLAVTVRFLVARDAFQRARDAFARWDLPRAERLFRRAIAAQPTNAEAHLWLAQSEALEGKPVAKWGAAARSAATLAPGLPSARDSALAFGLLFLADSQYPQACAQYERARAQDTLEVLAWYGLGECRRLDRAVVRDVGSPTGWRFRSSYQGAVGAYQRALEIAPSLNEAFGPAAYERLAGLLVAEPIWAKPGVALSPDTGLFLAWPALDHDTLLLLPHRAAELAIRAPPSHAAAVAKGQALLGALVTRWVGAFPRSAQAHAVLARVLELRGELVDATGRRSALSEILRARGLEVDPALNIRDALTEVRLNLKLLRFGRARELADSMLAANPDPDSSSAWYLAPAAALVGRAHRAAQLLGHTASDTSFQSPVAMPRGVPLPATVAALRLLAYASLATPVDSLPALEQQLVTALRRYVVQAERIETLRRQLQDLSDLVAFPVRGLTPQPRPAALDFESVVEWQLTQGDTAAARAGLKQARRDVAAAFGPGSLLPAHVYLQAWLSAAVHDTADAEWLLDLSLNNLAAAPTMLIGEVPQAATLVRAMVLRARLASRRHDNAAARRWAARVDTLWSGSDVPELRALVDSLRSL